MFWFFVAFGIGIYVFKDDIKKMYLSRNPNFDIDSQIEMDDFSLI